MGKDVGYWLIHERGQADAWAHVVTEDEECSCVGAHASVQGHTVADGGHTVLADAETDVSVVRSKGAGLDLFEALEVGVVGACKIGASSDEARKVATERV